MVAVRNPKGKRRVGFGVTGRAVLVTRFILTWHLGLVVQGSCLSQEP